MAAAISLDKLSARIDALAITRHYTRQAWRAACPNTLRLKRARSFFPTQRFDLKAHAHCRRQLPAGGMYQRYRRKSRLNCAVICVMLCLITGRAWHASAPARIAHPGKAWFLMNAHAL